MLSISRFNILCAFGPTVAKTLLSATVLSAIVPKGAYCAPSGDSKGGDDSDIFKMMAQKARAAMDTFSSDSAALDVDPRGIFDAATKKAHDLIAQVKHRESM